MLERLRVWIAVVMVGMMVGPVFEVLGEGGTGGRESLPRAIGDIHANLTLSSDRVNYGPGDNVTLTANLNVATEDIVFDFLRTWGGANQDGGNCIYQDGNYIYVGGIAYNTSSGDTDALVMKFDGNGTVIWARTWNGLGDDGVSSMTIHQNIIYSTGYINYGTSMDLLLLAYDTSGNYLWNKTWGGGKPEAGSGITLVNDALYVSGSTQSYGAGWLDVLLLKYNITNDNFEWYKTWGSGGDDTGGSLVYLNNTLYVGVHANDYPGNAGLLKFDMDGNLMWVRTWSTGSSPSVTTDGTNVIAVGGLGGILRKYSQDGDLLLEVQFSASSGNSFTSVFISDGLAYALGHGNTFGFGGYDVFFVVYNLSTGNEIFNKTWGGSQDDYGMGICVSEVGEIYVTGLTKSYGAGDWDVYLIKYRPAFFDRQFVELQNKLPIPSGNFGVAWTGNDAYIFGGSQDNPSLPTNQIVRFRPSDGSVKVMSATMPGTWAVMPAVWTGRYAYTFGGYYYLGTEQWQDGIVRYDPITDTATLLATRLPRPLMGNTAIFDGQDVYIFGGKSTGYQFTTDILKFDITTETITTLPVKLPDACYLSSAAWTGKYAYLFGGENDGGPGAQSLDKIVRFDPSTQSVAVMSSRLPFTLCAASAIYDGKNILITGGETDDGAVHTLRDTVMSYDPMQDTIDILSVKLPIPMMASGAVYDGKSTYILGGWMQQDIYTDKIFELAESKYDISFQVDDPTSQTYFIMTNTTDSTGNSTVSFTFPLDAPEGVYSCSASANVSGTVLLATTSFRVGWPWSPVLTVIPVNLADVNFPGDLIDIMAYTGYRYAPADANKTAARSNLTADVYYPNGISLMSVNRLTDATGLANMSFVIPNITMDGTYTIIVTGFENLNGSVQFQARRPPIPVPRFDILDVLIPVTASRGVAFTIGVIIENTFNYSKDCLLVIQILDSNNVPVRPQMKSLTVPISAGFLANMTITIDPKAHTGTCTVQIQLLSGLPRNHGYAYHFRNGTLNVQ